MSLTSAKSAGGGSSLLRGAQALHAALPGKILTASVHRGSLDTPSNTCDAVPGALLLLRLKGRRAARSCRQPAQPGSSMRGRTRWHPASWTARSQQNPGRVNRKSPPATHRPPRLHATSRGKHVTALSTRSAQTVILKIQNLYLQRCETANHFYMLRRSKT